MLSPEKIAELREVERRAAPAPFTIDVGDDVPAYASQLYWTYRLLQDLRNNAVDLLDAAERGMCENRVG